MFLGLYICVRPKSKTHTLSLHYRYSPLVSASSIFNFCQVQKSLLVRGMETKLLVSVPLVLILYYYPLFLLVEDKLLLIFFFVDINYFWYDSSNIYLGRSSLLNIPLARLDDLNKKMLRIVQMNTCMHTLDHFFFNR